MGTAKSDAGKKLAGAWEEAEMPELSEWDRELARQRPLTIKAAAGQAVLRFILSGKPCVRLGFPECEGERGSVDMFTGPLRSAAGVFGGAVSVRKRTIDSVPYIYLIRNDCVTQEED